MSIFKDKAIVLKIDKVKEKEFLYTIFSYNYWKIKVNKNFRKKEKNLDYGYIIDVEIITSENSNIHKVRNIKIKSEFNSIKDRTFNELNSFFEILLIIYSQIPDWISQKEIFWVIEEINTKKNINEIKLILAKLKIKAILWDLKENDEDKLVEKILKYIHNSKIDDIFKLKWFNEDIIEKLKNI